MRLGELRRSTRVIVLTGAGISAESGIATFRDAKGLWNQHRVEDVASPDGFAKDPALVWRFYSERRKQALTVHPNPAHFALSGLEEMLEENFFLCTQNVDSLHELAGSKRVLHVHGELFKTRCSNLRCKTIPFEDRNLYFESPPRCLACDALLRPDIVWFGEIPTEMHWAKREAQKCDLFLCIGSSGHVYPAAGLVRELHYRRSLGEKVHSLYVGLERPLNASDFDEVILGKAGEILPSLLSFDELTLR